MCELFKKIKFRPYEVTGQGHRAKKSDKIAFITSVPSITCEYFTHSS